MAITTQSMPVMWLGTAKRGTTVLMPGPPDRFRCQTAGNTRSGSAPGKRSGAFDTRRARILARGARPVVLPFARQEAHRNDRRAHLDAGRAREAVAHDVPAVLRLGLLFRHDGHLSAP